MPSPIKVDRETASQINPLISSTWTEDTLDAVAAVVYEIGFMISETDLAKDHVFRVFEACAAALQWERENIESVAQHRKEPHHV